MYLIFFKESHVHQEKWVLLRYFKEEKGDFSHVSREMDVIEANELS
jgi:hypothetical protein